MRCIICSPSTDRLHRLRSVQTVWIDKLILPTFRLSKREDIPLNEMHFTDRPRTDPTVYGPYRSRLHGLKTALTVRIRSYVVDNPLFSC